MDLHEIDALDELVGDDLELADELIPLIDWVELGLVLSGVVVEMLLDCVDCKVDLALYPGNIRDILDANRCIGTSGYFNCEVFSPIFVVNLVHHRITCII